jgi:recombination protein RecT
MGRDLNKRVTERNTSGNGGEVEQRKPATLAQQIRDMEQQFQVAMPRGAEAAQLIRDALTALRTNPKLQQCDATTVLGALMTCAQLGLRPGVLGHAWVLPFWDNRSRSHKAQLVIGYQGYRELAQRSGQIATVIARPVHEYDEFDIDYGIADNLVHKPKLRGHRGEVTGYYAIVKYTTGGYAFWHMSREDAEAHRDRYAMAKDKSGRIVGPWRDNFDEMALKSVFLRLAKWMPKSTDLASAIETDGTVRVDLSADNGAILHGEHPAEVAIDGEVVDDAGEQDSSGRTEDADEENWQTLIDAEQQEAAQQEPAS